MIYTDPAIPWSMVLLGMLTTLIGWASILAILTIVSMVIDIFKVNNKTSAIFVAIRISIVSILYAVDMVFINGYNIVAFIWFCFVVVWVIIRFWFLKKK